MAEALGWIKAARPERLTQPQKTGLKRPFRAREGCGANFTAPGDTHHARLL